MTKCADKKRDWIVVRYSTDTGGDPKGGSRLHDFVEKVHCTKSALWGRLRRSFQIGPRQNAKLYVFKSSISPSCDEYLFSPDSWDPSEEQLKIGYSYNCGAKVFARVVSI